MKRKVIQLAHKTLVVSLPSKWARDYGVRKGAEMEVDERGQQIVFSTSKRSDSERAVVDAEKLDSNALRRWVLPSLHKKGYDEIEVRYRDAKTVDAVQRTIQDLLIGFAIVEQGNNKCVVRVVAEEQEKEFDAMLRRAFLVTKSMGESLHSYIREGKLGRLKELLVLERTNNQLTNFCERILNKKGYKEDRKRTFAYVTAWNLEKICDHYADICKIMLENPRTKLSKNTIAQIDDANSYFNSFYELFYRFDINELSNLSEKREEFSKSVVSLLKNSSVVETRVLCSLNELVTKTSDFSASFIALNS